MNFEKYETAKRELGTNGCKSAKEWQQWIEYQAWKEKLDRICGRDVKLNEARLAII